MELTDWCRYVVTLQPHTKNYFFSWLSLWPICFIPPLWFLIIMSCLQRRSATPQLDPPMSPCRVYNGAQPPHRSTLQCRHVGSTTALSHPTGRPSNVAMSGLQRRSATPQVDPPMSPCRVYNGAQPPHRSTLQCRHVGSTTALQCRHVGSTTALSHRTARPSNVAMSGLQRRSAIAQVDPPMSPCSVRSFPEMSAVRHNVAVIACGRAAHTGFVLRVAPQMFRCRGGGCPELTQDCVSPRMGCLE